jgi:hypothetical protein
VTPEQRTAIAQHCRFAFETAQPQFGHVLRGASLVLTVNSGYEGIEKGFGGPVWHASVAGPALADRVKRMLALKSLRGVGQEALQWEEGGRIAYHVRRRLTPAEAAMVGEVRDLRGTDEGQQRFERIKPVLPPPALYMALEELSNT